MRALSFATHHTSIRAKQRASAKLEAEVRYLPARKKAPVEALSTPKPFLSVALLP